MPLVFLACIFIMGSYTITEILMNRFSKLHKLALCTAMHSTAGIMCAAAHAAYTFPLAEIFMPKLLCNSMAFGIGLVMYYISYLTRGIEYTSEEFYMHHAWSAVVICPFVFRGLASSVMR